MKRSFKEDSRILKFIFGQVLQIQEGGLTVLRKKVFLFLLTLVAISVVLVIRALKPILLVRLGRLGSGSIEALYHAEWYLCDKQAGLGHQRELNFFILLPQLMRSVIGNG